MKILVTGGPVHAHLDSVKIITNNFRGGRMEETARILGSYGFEVTYLGARHIIDIERKAHNLSWEKFLTYRFSPGPGDGPGVRYAVHEGFEDYRKKVLELAPTMDAVVLGAAVANLIPKTPWKDKFPSHDYKPGDVVDIPFVVAPRIIDEVRAVAPRTRLFGFKLLDNVDRVDLEAAAKKVLHGARADAVIANDRVNLDEKLVVVPEGGSFVLDEHVARFIARQVRAQHYRTVLLTSEEPRVEHGSNHHVLRAFGLIDHRLARFTEDAVGKYIHGAVAVRLPEGGFVTHARGKTRKRDLVVVQSVNHKDRVVTVKGQKKATRGAPLFAAIFEKAPHVEAIIHTHRHHNLQKKPYAPPGTTADVENADTKSFRIEGHGTFFLLGKDDNDIIGDI